jgi:hypothetical protein
MSWLDDADNFLGDVFGSIGESDLLQLGIAYGLSQTDINKPQIPQTGYQGKIPEYQAVRQRLPVQGMPDRRPGEGGRRYFTDTVYAKKPEQEVPTLEEAQAIVSQQAAAMTGQQPAAPAPAQDPNQPVQQMAAGGLTGIAGQRGNVTGSGMYLNGSSDGMADLVPANIDGKQEARLSDGEFVIPADVVSHLGNGNSDAGAKQLHQMMDNVRKERTGTTQQGKEINPEKFMPKMAQGGIARFQTGGSTSGQTSGEQATDATGVVDETVGQQTGTESSLSTWAGDYVTDMLGKGQALADQPYQAYEGPLTAGASELQQQAFQGIGALQGPQNVGAYTPQTFGAQQAEQYINPYLQAALEPQRQEAVRQAQIQRIADAGRLTKAGAFGGSRQAIMEAEGARNLQGRLSDITAQGYREAFDKAQQQFNTEQDRAITAQDRANQLAFDVLKTQADAGAIQRGITSEGIAADMTQFEEERDFPYKAVQYQQSLLQGLPLAAQSYQYSQPSQAMEIGSTMQFLQELYDRYGNKSGGEDGSSGETSGSEGTT